MKVSKYWDWCIFSHRSGITQRIDADMATCGEASNIWWHCVYPSEFKNQKKFHYRKQWLSDSSLLFSTVLFYKDKGSNCNPLFSLAWKLLAYFYSNAYVLLLLVSEAVCAYKMPSLILQIGPLLLAMKERFSIWTKGRTKND